MARSRKFEPAKAESLNPGDLDFAEAPGDTVILALQDAMESGAEATSFDLNDHPSPPPEGKLVPDMPDDALIEVPGMGLFFNKSRQRADVPERTEVVEATTVESEVTE